MSQTQSPDGAADPLDPFGQWKAMRDRSMEAWSKMMLDIVNSDAYARATAEWLDTCLTRSQLLQQSLDQVMLQTLSQYKIPSTADIARLSERISNIELNLDNLDARLDEALQLLKGLAATIPALERAAAAPPPEPTAPAPERSTAAPAKERTAPTPATERTNGKVKPVAEPAVAAATNAATANAPTAKASRSPNPTAGKKESTDAGPQERK